MRSPSFFRRQTCSFLRWRPVERYLIPPLRRRPLTTLSHPPPTAFTESQWGEPCSDASGTGTHIAGLLSKWLVLLPLVGICKYSPSLRDWHHWESTTLQQLPLSMESARGPSLNLILLVLAHSHITYSSPSP